jgi:hypothetical protein
LMGAEEYSQKATGKNKRTDAAMQQAALIMTTSFLKAVCFGLS